MIFCVEDDPSVRDIEVYTLESVGFKAEGFADGASFFEALKARTPELVLLDIMLPGEDGTAILKKLKASPSTNALPVIMATAKDAESSKVLSLDLGADDYLVKPFALSELVARIEAILRRSQGSRTRRLQVADLNYDLDTLHVSRGAQTIKLNPIGLKLLAILMQKSPAVVTREALEEALWGDNCPDSDSLRSHVHQLRQVLDKPFEQQLLHTIHGVGYRLAPSSDAF